MATQFAIWQTGLWAEGLWAPGVWEQIASSVGGHGFEMRGGSKPIWRRLLERRNALRVKPRRREEVRKARAIEIKAARAVLADASEPVLRALMRDWLELKPILPAKADPYGVFLDQVARRLRQWDEDEAAVLLLM